MRRVRKPWPPRNVSPVGQPPCSFRDAEKQYLAALGAALDRTAFARMRFDQLDKAKLREVMYREQGCICVYCERRVEEGHPAPRIDHWRPLSKSHDRAMHWKNLYLACPSLDTCDETKGDRSLKRNDADSDLPWPADCAYENFVGFTSLGEIYVRADIALDDATREALELAITTILNLNHSALVAARAAAINGERDRLRKDYPNKRAPTSDRRQRAQEILAKSTLLPFVSIRVAWLRKRVGTGR